MGFLFVWVLLAGNASGSITARQEHLLAELTDGAQMILSMQKTIRGGFCVTLMECFDVRVKG